MLALKQRILKDGRNLGNGILKVDGFINHQVDPALMNQAGEELARRMGGLGATKVLTAEISGIAPALTTALHLGLPVVYARKQKPITMPNEIFLTLAPSHTKGRTVELIISPEYLRSHERVLIIDDFLASGQTILAGAAGPGRRGYRGGHRRRHRKILRRRPRRAGRPQRAHRGAGDY